MYVTCALVFGLSLFFPQSCRGGTENVVFRMLFVRLLVLMVKKEIPLLGNLLGKVCSGFSTSFTTLLLKYNLEINFIFLNGLQFTT